ncbi:MAG TPA: FHA domain-containing protein, partial [Ktedonobacteraceae bacterium]|nr:FHA domain-containing protein [Ktedonobacteraceae bacterium]
MTIGNQTQANQSVYSRRLRVFLCHSSGDKPAVRVLYKRLQTEGIDPWLDEENLLPGQYWEAEIRKAVEQTDVVIICLSISSINKTGFVQKEITFALDIAEQQPEDTIFLIPLKLEECTIPNRLNKLHWVNYFEETGHARLMRALEARAQKLGIALEPVSKTAPSETFISRAPTVAASLVEPELNDGMSRNQTVYLPVGGASTQGLEQSTMISSGRVSSSATETTTQPGPGFVSIEFLSGPLKGTIYTINKPVIALGREPANDVVISYAAISRHHAQIVYSNGRWSIRKLAPQNTVTVNKKEVQQETLNNGDIVVLGTVCSFRFLPGSAQEIAAPPHEQPLVTQAVQNVPPSASIVGSIGTELKVIDGTRWGQQSPWIEISSNIHREKKIYPLVNPIINIGRAPAPENDIVIDENVVSGQHLQVVRDGNQMVIVHPHPARQRTANGLIYQGRVIQGDQPFRKILTRGDIFRIGDEHGTLVTLTYNDGSGASQEPVLELRPIPLNSPRITIGRHPDNMVVLNHPQISSHHASIEQVQGGHRISDLRSTSGVFVNGQRISDHLLKSGDEVRIGPFKLTYTGTRLTQQDESNGIRIDALHLKKLGNKNVILLNDISLVVPPRKFVALVGGAGAGRSTLMDALSGLRPAQQGTVLYNGQDYYKNLAAFSTQLGYVPQDDIIHRDLTVERALYYDAKLRLPTDFTDEQIKQRIEEVLEEVELTQRRKLLVSKLSSGQRKRVSIALELLANPSVFFLDEPTSGLDPGLDRKMMFLLRKLADKGHTIVLVTHATNDIINTCDYICFLAQGGRVAYYGPPEEAKKYFGKSAFTDIYYALEPTDDNPNIPAEAEARFKASPEYQKYVVDPLMRGPAARVGDNQSSSTIKRPKRSNPRNQFWLLSKRSLELLKNDGGHLALLILQVPLVALVLLFLAGYGTFDLSSVATCVPQGQFPNSSGNSFSCQNVVNALNTSQGQVYMQQHNFTSINQAVQSFIAPGSGGDAQKILFIMALAAVAFGCMNGIREIVRERAIYQHERMVNLGIIPYIFSKIAVLGMLCLLQ